jgi:hypothetical protein
LDARTGHDRRRADTRRLATGGAGGAPVGAVLPVGFERGWLAFERVDDALDAPEGAAIRRLAPIPPDWETCPEPSLAEYLARAAHGRTPT